EPAKCTPEAAQRQPRHDRAAGHRRGARTTTQGARAHRDRGGDDRAHTCSRESAGAGGRAAGRHAPGHRMSSPAKLGFGESPRSTVGIEWEIGLVDPASADLAQSAPRVLEALARDDAVAPAGDPGHAPQVTGEFMKNTIELVSGVCRTVGQAGADLRHLMDRVQAVTDPLGLELMGGGTHPFARGADQEVDDKERYARILDRTGIWGTQLIIWGLHVHVGIESRDKALPLMKAMLTYFPHLQALSA